MEIAKTDLQQLIEQTNHPRHGRAPRDVLDALASLLPNKTADALYATATTEDNSVVWRVAALSKGLLVWVHASRKGNAWTLDSSTGYNVADELTAWARPTATIDKVSIKTVTRGSQGPGWNDGGWQWDITYTINFQGDPDECPFEWTSNSETFFHELLKVVAESN